MCILEYFWSFKSWNPGKTADICFACFLTVPACTWFIFRILAIYIICRNNTIKVFQLILIYLIIKVFRTCGDVAENLCLSVHILQNDQAIN